ncbi:MULTISPECIES: LysM peptidoglycan-binding domain-containing protein [Chitinophagaceae]
MKKYRIILLGAGIFIASLVHTNVQAQQATKHMVVEGETLSKIAKNYGTTVGDIMRFNGMNTQSKLIVGKEIKIPPAGVHIIGRGADSETATATPPTSKANSDNAGRTHTVVTGESLYKIAKVNHITVANLKAWNNLSDDKIHVGQVLQLSDTPAASVAASKTTPDDTTVKSIPEEVTNTGTSGIIVANNAQTATSKPSGVKVVSTETTTLANGNGGAFADVFGRDVDNQTLSEASGKAKTFKSQSGWSDQKFYIMMNDVTPGGIVKVTYNGASVFAKVLWNLIDTKENSGLTFRISDATASALGVSGDTFDIKVDYYK